MNTLKSETRYIRTQQDIVFTRQVVREWAVALGLNIVDQTKVVTAASEIARNTYSYGGGGTMLIEIITNNTRSGLRLTFEDQGPGIADVEVAMQDYYTTQGGLGLGLGGTRRLVNEFNIQSQPGKGTKVTFIKWK